MKDFAEINIKHFDYRSRKKKKNNDCWNQFDREIQNISLYIELFVKN